MTSLFVIYRALDGSLRELPCKRVEALPDGVRLVPSDPELTNIDLEPFRVLSISVIDSAF